jgi:ferredoxin
MGTNLSIVKPQLYIRTAMPLTPLRREVLWIKEGRKCHWCGVPTRLCSEQAVDQATIEHIIPRGKGGTDDPDNLCSACARCNNRRSHESNLGLPDGSLLGKYKETSPYQVPKRVNDTVLKVPRKVQTEDILREQRDQAQKEIAHLRKELKVYEIIVSEQKQELKAIKSITIWRFLRKRLAEWILS